MIIFEMYYPLIVIINDTLLYNTIIAFILDK